MLNKLLRLIIPITPEKIEKLLIDKYDMIGTLSFSCYFEEPSMIFGVLKETTYNQSYNHCFCYHHEFNDVYILPIYDALKFTQKQLKIECLKAINECIEKED